jgi:hypothetical protein
VAEAYFLSAEDVKLVKELLAEKRSKRGNTTGRAGAQEVDHQEHQAPETYTAYTTNGITARSGTTPGEGQVYIYQTNIEDPDTPLLEDTYLDVTALNLSETAVDAGSYCLVHRTKDGQWYVQSPGGTAAECCGWCTDWWSRYGSPTGNQFHSSTIQGQHLVLRVGEVDRISRGNGDTLGSLVVIVVGIDCIQVPLTGRVQFPVEDAHIDPLRFLEEDHTLTTQDVGFLIECSVLPIALQNFLTIFTEDRDCYFAGGPKSTTCQ